MDTWCPHPNTDTNQILLHRHSCIQHGYSSADYVMRYFSGRSAELTSCLLHSHQKGDAWVHCYINLWIPIYSLVYTNNFFFPTYKKSCQWRLGTRLPRDTCIVSVLELQSTTRLPYRANQQTTYLQSRK